MQIFYLFWGTLAKSYADFSKNKAEYIKSAVFCSFFTNGIHFVKNCSYRLKCAINLINDGVIWKRTEKYCKKAVIYMLVRPCFSQKSGKITPGTAVHGQSHRTFCRFLISIYAYGRMGDRTFLGGRFNFMHKKYLFFNKKYIFFCAIWRNGYKTVTKSRHFVA